MSGFSKEYTFTSFTEGRLDARGVSGNKRPRDRDATPTGLIIDNTCRVYITQIPLERIERDGADALRAEFEAFGPVESYKMFTERSGRFIGSVLCTYRNPADASMAVQNMNDRVVDSSVLKVSLSRDHGVVLLHQSRPRDRRGFGDYDDDGDGKWEHDQYQAVMQGGEDVGGSYYNDNNSSASGGRYAARRGGRGMRRHGGAGRGVSVEEAFERYIASRDKELVYKAPNPDGSNSNNNDNNNNNNKAGEGVVLESNEVEVVGGSTSEAYITNNDTAEMYENSAAPLPIGGSNESVGGETQ